MMNPIRHSQDKKISHSKQQNNSKHANMSKGMNKSINDRSTSYRAAITGCGSFVPDKILTNEDLAKMVDTTDEWITTRTGIKARHITTGS